MKKAFFPLLIAISISAMDRPTHNTFFDPHAAMVARLTPLVATYQAQVKKVNRILEKILKQMRTGSNTKQSRDVYAEHIAKLYATQQKAAELFAEQTVVSTNCMGKQKSLPLPEVDESMKDYIDRLSDKQKKGFVRSINQQTTASMQQNFIEPKIQDK